MSLGCDLKFTNTCSHGNTAKNTGKFMLFAGDFVISMTDFLSALNNHC